MTQEEKNGINAILGNIFMRIRNGEIDRAWDVYDEFDEQLKCFMGELEPTIEKKPSE